MSAWCMETVISKADPLIENPPSLFSRHLTDPRAMILPRHTFQINLMWTLYQTVCHYISTLVYFKQVHTELTERNILNTK